MKAVQSGESGQTLIAQLREFGASEISDALDRFGVPGQCFGIRPLRSSFTLCGRAWTGRYGSVGEDPGSVGDYIDDLGPGDVVVLDNQGRTDVTIWGDLLTFTASRRGLAGTVLDGVCRDAARSEELNYPIFSRGNWMRTGKDRVRLDVSQTPVNIGGVRVEPGDYLLGDGDGLVAIPARRINEILAAATEIRAKEDQIREAIASGESLREARAKAGYHGLQSRKRN